MRRMTGLCAAVVVLAAGGGAGAPAPADIKGTYLIVGLEFGGKAQPAEVIAKEPEADRTIKITADKMIAVKDGKEDPASYTIDTTKTPHHIDVTAKTAGKEEKMHGIFKQDGDTLTVCFALSDKAADRPKEFKSTADNKAVIMTLKMKK